MEEHTLSENDYDEYYPSSPEELAEECPECKSNKMMRYMEANGLDDYRYVYECRNCGATYTE
jgi:DNA-directed RNA polymerase subunit M/transcription elongation factor TFIIS